jgi:hypothetical protein
MSRLSGFTLVGHGLTLTALLPLQKKLREDPEVGNIFSGGLAGGTMSATAFFCGCMGAYARFFGWQRGRLDVRA